MRCGGVKIQGAFGKGEKRMIHTAGNKNFLNVHSAQEYRQNLIFAHPSLREQVRWVGVTENTSFYLFIYFETGATSKKQPHFVFSPVS